MKALIVSFLNFLRGRARDKEWNKQLGAAADLPVVDRLAHMILSDAVRRRASEIQVGVWTKSELGMEQASPGEAIGPSAIDMEEGSEYRDDPGKEFAVRYRIAGELRTMTCLPQCEWPQIRAWFEQKARAVRSPDTGRGSITLKLTRADGAEALARFQVIIPNDGEAAIVASPIYEDGLLSWLTASPGQR